jgi:hypothetical protein
MDIIRIIIKNTYILYVFDIIKLDSLSNMFGQTLSNLTLTKPRMQGKKGQREYCRKQMYKEKGRPRNRTTKEPAKKRNLPI